MNFAATAAQREARARAAGFVAAEVAPHAAEWDESGRFPVELVARMGELGLLSGPLPVEYGGAGMDYVSFALVYEELGRADASLRGFLAVHGGLVTQCVYEHGTAAQRAEWLPRLASGAGIGCYCLTEPEAGSDAGNLQATCTRRGDEYVLSGTKWWITNGNIADVAIVFARDHEIRTDKPHRQICAFLVPTATPGFNRKRMELEPLGHRAADHALIELSECVVPAAALLGEPGRGFRVAMGALDHGRLGVAAGAIGIGQACLDAALDFVRERHAFGRRLADLGMLQATLADMSVQLESARLLTYLAAWKKDQGLDTTADTARAKLAATEAALRIAGEAVLLHGARGYDSASLVARHWRDVKGMQIYEGTSHIQRMVIARSLVGGQG
jgi:alkylation response protein AidB-like acyl-CoA dehydrogenase